jgi:DNA polymerase (family 10)
MRGFLHCHTKYSDGSNTVTQLAEACRAAGYEYIGITDHSQAAAYAGGLKADDLARQAEEIDEANEKLEGIRILKGVEADILQDGRIDFDEPVLAALDFVIASIHSRFNMGEREMTARMLAAMDNPHLTIIGHPTGRLLLSRDPYGLDLDAVIEKAAATGVALEVNADPHRLDLDWRSVRRARERGVAISIGADAHSVAGVSNVDHGIGMARKGWLGPDDVVNAQPLDRFLARVASRRRG